jgi:flavin reductase (DIM6/NTAB) family NADH-FMN oxidoreductase RutF
VTVDPAVTPAAQLYKLLIGAVVPRPIAFVSTVSAAGARNLAPFSFFNAICGEPPTICFSTSYREPRKDTFLNIQATREFVVNVVTEKIAAQMNLASGEYQYGTDEFAIAGLTPAPSDVVRAPRVLESPVNMECKLVQMVEISTKPRGGTLIIGEVVRFHVDNSLGENFHIEPDRLLAIGRMGGNLYSRTRDRFEMVRPKV